MNYSEIDAHFIGERIKEARSANKMTQYDLSAETGISTTQISAYENGRKCPGLSTLCKIADATNFSLDELIRGSINERPIAKAKNEGELIVNCLDALFGEKVIGLVEASSIPSFSDEESGDELVVGFSRFDSIINNLIKKLQAFENEKDNYPNPKGFKTQLLAAAAKQINDIAN